MGELCVLFCSHFNLFVGSGQRQIGPRATINQRAETRQDNICCCCCCLTHETGQLIGRQWCEFECSKQTEPNGIWSHICMMIVRCGESGAPVVASATLCVLGAEHKQQQVDWDARRMLWSVCVESIWPANTLAPVQMANCRAHVMLLLLLFAWLTCAPSYSLSLASDWPSVAVRAGYVFAQDKHPTC